MDRHITESDQLNIVTSLDIIESDKCKLQGFLQTANQTPLFLPVMYSNMAVMYSNMESRLYTKRYLN